MVAWAKAMAMSPGNTVLNEDSTLASSLAHVRKDPWLPTNNTGPPDPQNKSFGQHDGQAVQKAPTQSMAGGSLL